MSKRKQIEEARASVGYVPKAMTCSQCAHFRTDKAIIPWMAAENDRRQEQGLPIRYDPRSLANQHDVNARCEQPGVVPFSVKRSGQCRNWAEKPGAN